MRKSNQNKPTDYTIPENELLSFISKVLFEKKTKSKYSQKKPAFSKSTIMIEKDIDEDGSNNQWL